MASIKQDETGGYWIESNGVWKQVGSSYEVNVAIALLKYGWDFEYLAGWWIGGRKLEIDFRVFTVPKVLWVFVDGQYYHSGDVREQDRFERIMLFSLTKNIAYPPVSVTNKDCATLEAAEAWVLHEPYLGRR